MKYLLAFLVTFTCFASVKPNSFQADGKKFIFVDFQNAQYEVVYDLAAKKASVVSTINFEAGESGFAVFDLVEDPTSVILDGKVIDAPLLNDPDRVTTFRFANSLIAKGSHKLIVSSPLNELVSFKDGGVSSAFWASDLDDRNYLELYVVTNFEYDQYSAIYDIKFIGNANQVVYSNASITKTSNNHYRLETPKYFTSSSLFFHTLKAGTTKESNFTFKSLDGRNVPVTIYLKKTETESFADLKKETVNVLNELEADYGSFPHPKVVIYNAGDGGMEYCGATMTSLRALGHELTHSYFARGVMPVNGNAGWLDEAIATWRDDDYPQFSDLSRTSAMASHPPYTRKTDVDAYTFGAKFMMHLSADNRDAGGLKPFLKSLVAKRLFKPMSTENFIADLEKFFAKDYKELFKFYVYGRPNYLPSNKKSHHPHHQKMTVKQLRAYL